MANEPTYLNGQRATIFTPNQALAFVPRENMVPKPYHCNALPPVFMGCQKPHHTAGQQVDLDAVDGPQMVGAEGQRLLKWSAVAALPVPGAWRGAVDGRRPAVRPVLQPVRRRVCWTLRLGAGMLPPPPPFPFSSPHATTLYQGKDVCKCALAGRSCACCRSSPSGGQQQQRLLIIRR